MDITFIPQELNQRLSDTTPDEYFSDFVESDNFEQIMQSHLIPVHEESGIWSNDYDTFLEQRAELVYIEFMDLIGEYSALESDLRNDPHGAVKEIEMRVRNYIHERLVAESENGAFWGEVPNDVNSNVHRRISNEKKENPEFTVDTDRQKLDYCNIMDYAKIINARWDIFEKDFPSKSAVQSRLKDFADYRNGVAHNREVDRFTQMDGEVAIQWLDSCITEQK